MSNDEPTPTLGIAPGASGRSKIPTQIGRYQVLERVGKGGMGVLYRGIDPVLDREVAIKLMLGDFSDDTEQLRPRFYREARAVAKLQHRNIVTVFEFAEDGTTPYIVMEFLRGASLASRLEATPPLTLDDKLDIIAQLCAGLGYAHEQGVVHRDVKPANIFILTDTSVKLLDFGIAKLTTSNLTRQGDVLGSPSYMSPEQILGREDVDGRADVFSSGVVLYELLAGKKPFQAETTTAIVLKILNEQPAPLDTIDPDIPSRLAAAVKKALEKDPANRFETAADFARELQLVRRSLQQGENRTVKLTGPIGADTLAGAAPSMPAPPLPAAGRNWMLPAGIGAGVLVAAVAAVMTIGRPGAPKTDVKATNTASLSTPAPANAVPASGPITAPPTPTTTATEKTLAPTGESLQIASEPAGAAIAIDGRDTKQVTPATITLTGKGPHRLRLSKRGFQSMDARLAAADVQKGSLSYTLPAAEAAPAAAQIVVTATGPYAFSILDGGRVVSPANTAHQLNVAAGKRLRLVNSEYLLNQTVTVDSTPDKHAEFQVPALAKVTIRSNLETCKVKIGDRDLGNPPINNLTMAGGSYQVDLVCPNGQTKSQFINVAPGAQNARVILQ
jgi:serine/threonine-protein kinase